VTWKESSSQGRLVLRGTADEASTVVGTLRRGSFRRTLRFTAPAGAFVVRFKLPRTLLPGRYDLALTGTAGGRAIAPTTARATLAAPPEGVVDRFRISATRNGPDALSLTNARSIWATFHLAALPRFGRPLHVDIYGPPKGKKRAQKDFRRQALLVTRVGSAARLPKGRWTFVLRAGTTVVERASVRLR